MGRRVPAVIALAIAVSVIASACSGRGDAGLKMAPAATLPAKMQSAPVVVRDAYRFAAANPDVMKRIPCYCGCGAMGHRSNYSCYVAGVDASGAVRYDEHALGCSVCVDITQDTMRLLREGKSVGDIRAYVDARYAQVGPSNMP